MGRLEITLIFHPSRRLPACCSGGETGFGCATCENDCHMLHVNPTESAAKQNGKSVRCEMYLKRGQAGKALLACTT